MNLFDIKKILVMIGTTFVVGLIANVQPCDAQRVRLEARLTGPTAASGHANFESRDARRKFSTEVEDAAPNALLRIRVRRNATVIADYSIRTNAFGFADLNVDTDNGNRVPVMRVGDQVIVIQNSQRILSGTLQRVN